MAILIKHTEPALPSILYSSLTALSAYPFAIQHARPSHTIIPARPLC